MRYIEKGDNPPKLLVDYIESYRKMNNKYPSYQDFGTSGYYHVLKLHLIEEQHYLCCYCMKEIQDYNSHIEHFKPQSSYPNETLNYYNLMISCNGIRNKSENCGHKKDNWFNEYYSISPLCEKCEDLFTYTTDGHIKPNNGDTRADETITKLDLKSPLLERARRSAIYVSGLFDDDFDENKRMKLVEFYNTPEENKLSGFCNAIIYCLKASAI